MNKPTLLGAHMSIAGGIENAYISASSIGCTALQFFTHSNRQWAMKLLSQDAIKKVIAAQRDTGILHTVVHASYLINVASTSKETREKSKNMLRLELKMCADLSIPYLILHPGSNPSTEEGIAFISEALDEVLGDSPTILLLETMAGQGSQIGYRFEHLAAIKDSSSHKKKVGICLDTCHVWAAGYDFSDKTGYEKMWNEFDRILGIQNLKAIHLNDSKKSCGTQVDRHAEIGEGTISLETFRWIMNDPRLAAVPKVLETPNPELFAQNMDILKDLID